MEKSVDFFQFFYFICLFVYAQNQLAALFQSFLLTLNFLNWEKKLQTLNGSMPNKIQHLRLFNACDSSFAIVDF